MKYFIGLLFLISVFIQGYYINHLVRFAKMTVKWSAYKEQEIKCLNERLGYDENSIYLLQIHKTHSDQLKMYEERHGGYHDCLPECKKFYTEFTCWEFNAKNDKSIDNCASMHGFDEKEKLELKKTHNYFIPRNYKKSMNRTYK